MHLTFETLNGRSLTLTLDFEQFLQGPVMSHLAALQNDCDPVEILRDHLPAIVDESDDEELAQAVAEACLLAVNVEDLNGNAPTVTFSTISEVEVEDADLPAIRRLLLAEEMPVLAFPVGYFDPIPAA